MKCKIELDLHKIKWVELNPNHVKSNKLRKVMLSWV